MDVPYQMTVGGSFVYVCENLWKRPRPVKDVGQRSHVYNAVFSWDPRRPRYNRVAVYYLTLDYKLEKQILKSSFEIETDIFDNENKHSFH